MSPSLRRSCVLAAWDARKVARSMSLKGHDMNARQAKNIQRFYMAEAKRLRGKS